MSLNLTKTARRAQLPANVLGFLLFFASIATAAQPADWPGSWVEAESGRFDFKSSSIQYASGHLAVDLQNRVGEVAVNFDPGGPMDSAILMIRYARDSKEPSAGSLNVYAGPDNAVTTQSPGVRLVGAIALPASGRLSEWRWARLAVGDLPAGPQRWFFARPNGQTGAIIDLVGLVPGSTRGLWQPPNDVLLGNFRDSSRTLPAFSFLSVNSPAFGDLLPEPEFVGSNAKPVTYTLELHNNLFPGDLNVAVRGELRSDDGKSIPLPAKQYKVPKDSTQKVDYAFTLPSAGHFQLKLFPEADGISVDATRWLTTVPDEPVWVTPHGRGVEPLVISGPGATAVIDLETSAGTTGSLIYIAYQRRVRDESQGSETMQVFTGPADAKDNTTAGVRKLGDVTLDPLQRWGQQERWAVVNAGKLDAGPHRVFLALPPSDVEPNPALRPAINTIRRVGVVSDIDQGRWQPPIESLDPKQVMTVQNSQLLNEAVHVDAVSCTEVGHLFLGSKVLSPEPRDLPFRVTVASRIVTKPIDFVLRGRVIDASGVAIELAAMPLHLEPGERREIAYPVRPSAYGWFSLEVTADAMNLKHVGHSSFGILRDPHDGVRPDSMFGLAVGEKAEDAKVAQLIGVKWRRGIPFTNPADVVHKTGDPLVQKPDDTFTLWTPEEIQKVRDVIATWKSAGVMCLGYVNYNLPWNCLGGAAQGWHKNRPADMNQHVDMVYNLIKPLHDEVKYWEIWNEPWVGGWTWRTGTAQDYRDMSRMIWDRIKPEMPDVMLVGGGSTSYNRDVLFATGSINAGYVDGVSTHPYGKPDTNHPSFAATEAALLKKFGHGGDRGGIWATELGTAAFMFEPLSRDQADLMVARTVSPLYLLAKLGAGETPIRLFSFASQYGAGQFSGGEHNWWDATGGSPAPRPALVAFSAMTHFIEDTKLLGDIYSASKAAWALHFVRPDGWNVVVFFQEQSAAGEIDPIHANDSERAKGEMSLPAGDFECFDYLGRPTGVREGDHLRVPTQVWEARYFVSKLPVDQVRQSLLAATFTGLPSLTVNARSFDAPLATKPKLRFKIENVQPQVVDAKLEVTAPAEIQLATTSAELKAMKPGEVRWVEFDLASAKPNDINRYLIKYRLTAGGVTQEQQQIVQVATASYGTPKLDGDLGDWSDAVPVTMMSRGGKDWLQITMDPSQAAALMGKNQPADTTIYKFMTQWDEQNFYAAAIVPAKKQDLTIPYDGPISTTKNMPFMHDCLQLAFASLADNPDDLLKGNPLYEKSMAADVDYEFVIAMLANGKPVLDRLKAPGTNYQIYYPTNADTAPPLAAINGGRVVVRYDESNHAYVYELAIPWANVGDFGKQLAALNPGEHLRTNFAFAINDPNGPGRTYWTQEAGDLQAGSYGFSPTWGGGSRKMGGRIVTDWSFVK